MHKCNNGPRTADVEQQAFTDRLNDHITYATS